MKLSEVLFSSVSDLWKEAAEKPFVTGMATGTLDMRLFKNYMMQDYLYLKDYAGILKKMVELVPDGNEGDKGTKASKIPGLREFLLSAVKETEDETYRVHLPNMKKAGISDAELKGLKKAEVISEYVAYMRRQTEENGIIAGLTALLQCSWIYAYIGKTLTDAYPEKIASSPCKSWFDAYNCKEYLMANQKWIDLLDLAAAGIKKDEGEKLCDIFRTCAGYENRFWDELYTA